MSDYNSNGSGRPQGRGRGGRRPQRGGNNRNDSRGNFRPNRTKPPEPTGFQKFLSVVTFGLLGKPKASAITTPAPQSKAPRELGPIARGDREAATTGAGSNPRKSSRPPRQAPISAEVSTERLYVGNLSYDASESDLFELFNGSGRVKNAEVVVNSRTQRSKGFAFVTMMSVDEAKKAVAELNGQDFMGRPLVVGGAKPMSPRDEEHSSHSKSEAASDEPEEPQLAA